MRPLIAALAIAASLSVPGASAQTADRPDTEGGRYILREVDGEFLRVDRERGETSICRREDGSWTCILVADDRAAYEAEIDRLVQENADLARQVDGLRQELTALRQLAQPPGQPSPEVEPEAQPSPDAGAPRQDETEPQQTPEPRGRGEDGLTLDLPSDEDIDRLSETFETVMKRFVEMLRSLKSDLEEQNRQ